ncbi:MAG: hypothetical protein J6D16_01540 [Clostridia bacterium]|nr:hypothetical protein [Clostridia bacterium]
MVIDTKTTTLAYRCPHCGSGVISAVGMFSLSADMVKLKCTCGKSELTAVYTNDKKVRLSVPCLLCPKPHSFVVSQNVFYGRDLFLLPCPYSDINICFMGEMNHVKAELAKTELELLDMMEQNGINSYEALHGEEEDFLSDPQIRQIVMFVIGELKEDKKIFCKCPENTEGHYNFRMMEDGILVYCEDCGASHIVPVDSYLGAHAFLDCDSLKLE